MADPVKIEGLAEFRANLKAMDAALPRGLRVAFNQAADIVVADARPGIPTRSGKAKASVKARSTQAYVRIVGGGARVPYYPWLDFGGRIGRNKSVRRPFYPEGRYIYKAFYRNRPRFVEILESSLVEVARGAGIEVE